MISAVCFRALYAQACSSIGCPWFRTGAPREILQQGTPVTLLLQGGVRQAYQPPNIQENQENGGKDLLTDCRKDVHLYWAILNPLG